MIDYFRNFVPMELKQMKLLDSLTYTRYSTFDPGSYIVAGFMEFGGGGEISANDKTYRPFS